MAEKLIKAKLCGSHQECSGEHSIFIGGQCIHFVDGLATVSTEQFDLLSQSGYAEKNEAEETKAPAKRGAKATKEGGAE